MPLPLPNLDTRRWSDLVEEGRALIPRFSPGWTDHNIHDPGITLLELFAYAVEGQLYRANRIPDRHRRKFLALLGYAPRPPRPALVIAGVALPASSAPLTVPAGTVLSAAAGASVRLPFRTLDECTVVDAALVTLQLFDGVRHHDRTRALREQLPIPLFGLNPTLPVPYSASHAPVFYLGFDRALPAHVPVRLHFRLAGAMRRERQRLLDDAAERASECERPPRGCTPKCDPRAGTGCPEPADAAPTGGSGASVATAVAKIPPHHSVTLAWEYLSPGGWIALDAHFGELDDETRALSLDGFVTFAVPVAMMAASLGAVATPRFYIRCRLASGRYDAAPLLLASTMNALAAEQAVEATERFVVAAGAVVVGAIAAGLRARFALRIDAQGIVQRIEAGVADPRAPDLLVISFIAPTGAAPGEITLTIARLEPGSGLPEHHPVVCDAPVAYGAVKAWSLEENGAPAQRWVAWEQRGDLDSAGPMHSRFSLDATSGELHFGDGVRGRVTPDGAPMLAAYASTAAAAGSIPAARGWSLPDIAANRARLGSTFTALAAATITNASASDSAADEESIGSAAARASSALWAHERLVRLCPIGGCSTLDQLDRATVLDLPDPERATTLLDFERIALEIPGTRVRRARAWAELDPNYPGLEASGTVTVVIVPELPLGRPAPSAGLIRAVRRWLDRRRVLCTRLVVVGPEYVVVDVTTKVRTTVGADASRVHDDVAAALAAFLDPLRGGPAGRGWPFGRDVYRSEILQVVDQVRGVDHVLELELSVGGQAVNCGNVCVPPTWLVASGTHVVQVAAT